MSQDYFLIFYAFLVGAAIGSFLNVCIYRWPAELSVLRPRSRCATCAQPIRWYDNVPIISWIVLRGRCRNCGAAVSIQYPIVELVCGILWAVAAARFGWDVETLRSAMFLTILLGIALTDAREMVIPDQFSLGGLVIGLAFAALPGGFPFRTALIGAVLAFAFFWAVKLVAEKALKKPALGIGDIHMMAMVGAFLGTSGAIMTMMLGSLLGLLIGVPLSWTRGQLAMLGTYLPLGTFLALGGALAHAWGEPIMRWYLGFFV
jgi:leader peptidase (prepilin peptidase) / N-methyltransferase